MRRLFLLHLSLVFVLLSGCSNSNKDSNGVSIAYSEREEFAPARWVFTVAGGEDIVSYQWQFSDDSFSSDNTTQDSSIEHTFAEPGIYRIRLTYQTSAGEEGILESEVSIGSGSISGTISAALNTLVDFDTRDPDEPNLNNNSFGNAQVLSSSANLSGVVDVNDVEDFYQLQLQQFQRLNFKIADENSNGDFGQVIFELFTADDQENSLIQEVTDLSTGKLPSAVVVPNKGNYFIRLTAHNASSAPRFGKPDSHSHGNYSLIIEDPVEVAMDSYAPDEINIMLKIGRQYQAQGLASKLNLGRIKNLSITNAQDFLASQHVHISAVAFNKISSTGTDAITEALTAKEQSHWQMLQTIEALIGHPDVLYAEPNWKRYPTALPVINDPFYTSQWHYNTINVEQAWQALNGRGSSDVTVAVLDTGVLTAHPDLTSNLVAGYDFVDNDPDANDPGDKGINGQRSSFHGTHVAGTIAASAANSMGGVGIASGVKIMPVRVLGESGGFTSDIIAGVCFSAQLTASNSSVCNNVNSASSAIDIMNLSLGGPVFSNIEQEVYDAVIDKGIIVIAAAGNESTSTPLYPAAYNNVVSVAAINRNLEQASYSNSGATIDVAAPGGDFSVDSGIISTWGDDRNGSTILTYGSLQGTSMAAPHVAGVAALMKSAKSDLDHLEFVEYLNAGILTQDLGAAGRDDTFGVGLIDAHKAVLAVQQSLEPQILSSNNHLFFNVSQLVINFSLSAAGVGSDAELGDITVQINGADNGSGGSWLILDKYSGLGRYQVGVERAGLLEGAYQAELVVSSSLSTIADVVLSVQLQVGNPALSSNAGVQYVVVIDEDAEISPEGFQPTVGGSAALIANNGQYDFQILGLKKGNYTVAAGSDLDFDLVICDAGESCGQYPIFGQPKVITISEGEAHFNINMSVNYVSSGIDSLSVGTLVPTAQPMSRVKEDDLELSILKNILLVD